MIRDWIRKLPSNAGAWALLQRLHEIDETIALARENYAKRIAKAAQARPIKRADIFKKLLASPDASLIFMQELGEGRILPSTQPEAIRVAMNHAEPLVRDLFERFAPDSMRIERLGSNIVLVKLLALAGDVKAAK